MSISQSQLVGLSCPQCQTTFTIEIWQIVDADEHQELIEKILTGSLNKAICENCQKEVSFAPPLLLYFPKQAPFLLFSPSPLVSTPEEGYQQAIPLIQNLQYKLGGKWRDEWLDQMPSPIFRSLLPFVIEDVINKKQTTNRSSLMELLDELSVVNGWGEVKDLLIRNPELLSIRTDLFLTAIIDTAILREDKDMLRKAEGCKNLLTPIRSISSAAGLDEALQFFSLFQEAQSADLQSEEENDFNLASRAKHLWAEVCASKYLTLLPTEMQQGFYNDAARCSMNVFFNKGNISDLDYAIGLFEQAISLSDRNIILISSLKKNLGTAFFARYEKKFDLSDLDKAIDVIMDSIEDLLDNGQKPVAQQYYKLAIAFKRRFQSSWKLQDIEQSIFNFKKAISSIDKEDLEYPRYLNDLGFSLQDFYQMNGSDETLIESIDVLKKAVELGRKMNINISNFLTNLGISLNELYKLSNNLEDLEDAIEYYRQAIETERNSVDPAFYNNLATGLVDLYQTNKSDEVLGEAIDLFKQAVQLVENPEDYQNWIGNLGNAYLEVYYADKEISYLDEAITCFQSGVDTANKTFGVASSLLLDRLATGYANRYEQLGYKADLDLAINYFTTAVELNPETSPDHLRYLSNLAQALWHRSSYGSINDLAQAIKIQHRAVNIALPGSLNRIDCLGLLGLLYSERYEMTGQLNDLVEAKKILKGVIQNTPSTSVHLSERKNSLGIILFQEGEKTGNLELIDDALGLFKEALNSISTNSKNRQAITLNIAVTFDEKYNKSKNLDDLNLSIESYISLIEQYNSLEIGYTSLLNNLANALTARYKETRNENDLDLVISYMEDAIKVTSLQSPDYSLFLNNLANAFRLKSDSLGGDSAKHATAYYKQACVMNSNPRYTLIASKTWGDWALERQSWEEAISAYEFGLETLNHLIYLQPFWNQKHIWMAESKDMFMNAAYALSKVGRYQDAIVILEQNRARQLSEYGVRSSILQLEKRHPEETAKYKRIAKQHSELLDEYSRYIDSKNLIFLGKGEKQRDWTTDFQTINREYKEILGTISQISGEFSPLSALSDIKFTTKPIVYLVPAKTGGVALIVYKAAVMSLWLNELTIKNTTDLVNRYMPTYRSWTMSYNWQLAMEEDVRKQWLSAFDDSTGWLGTYAISPLYQHLKNGDECSVVMIPVGPLVFLPLHASWTKSPETNNKKYALDDLVISYASSIKSLLEDRNTSLRNKSLFVDNPDSSLSFSDLPIKMATRFLPGSIVLQGMEASIDNIKSYLKEVDFAYFSTHGFADLALPLWSGISLADGILDISQLINIEGQMPRLMVLSACETGIPGTRLPNELLSLPGALMEMGVDGTISSLWAVEEFSTAMIMGMFFKLWSEQKLPIPNTLREAQIWFRDSCNEDLLLFASSIDPEFMEKHPKESEILSLNPKGHFYNAPFYWAPFYFTGKIDNEQPK